MTKETFAKQLHDKATRNLALSAEEQALLDAWYAEQDEAERKELEFAHPPQTAAALHTQIGATLEHIREATQNLQTLAAQNDVLRQEIAALQQRLTQTSTPQPV